MSEEKKDLKKCSGKKNIMFFFPEHFFRSFLSSVILVLLITLIYLINFMFEEYLHRENRIIDQCVLLSQKLKNSSLDLFFFTLIFKLIHLK